MTNILFISEHFNVAGTETFMLNVVQASDRTRFHYDFLIFRPSKNKYSELANSLGCRFYSIVPRAKSPIKYLNGLDSFFKTHAKDYDAVHWCGGDVSSIAPIFFAHKYGIKNIIVHAHNSSCTGLHTRLLHSLFRRLLPSFCTHFFACSSLAAKFFFGNRKTIIIKNGIDLKKYKFDNAIQKQYRNKLGIDDDTLVIGHIGRFEKVKNHIFLIDIFSELLKRRKNSVLMLIGIGSLEATIREKVNKLGLEKNVIFMGERNDIEKCLQAMDIFVMPSLYEGLPFVLVEAQAAGLPCLISDTINDDAVICPDMVKMSLSLDAFQWASKLMEIHENSIRNDTRQHLIEKGFSIEDTAKYLENIYTSEKDV